MGAVRDIQAGHDRTPELRLHLSFYLPAQVEPSCLWIPVYLVVSGSIYRSLASSIGPWLYLCVSYFIFLISPLSRIVRSGVDPGNYGSVAVRCVGSGLTRSLVCWKHTDEAVSVSEAY